MGRSYPSLGEQRKHKAKTSLTCQLCDNQATRRQFIQVNWFRGDDEFVDLGPCHYKDALKAYEEKSCQPKTKS